MAGLNFKATQRAYLVGSDSDDDDDDDDDDDAAAAAADPGCEGEAK
jgi:hypothetical protein